MLRADCIARNTYIGFTPFWPCQVAIGNAALPCALPRHVSETRCGARISFQGRFVVRSPAKTAFSPRKLLKRQLFCTSYEATDQFRLKIRWLCFSWFSLVTDEVLVAGEGLEPPRRCAVGYEPTPMTIFGQPALYVCKKKNNFPNSAP